MAEGVPSQESGYLGRGLTGPESARISLIPNDRRGLVDNGDDDDDDDDEDDDIDVVGAAIVGSFGCEGEEWSL